jgi:adenine-specific DNA-methyltransferase
LPAAPHGNGLAKAYRHKGEKRRNIPPAAIAAEGRVPAAPKLQYSYSPRLDPVLRFDSTGAPDKLSELLEKAKREPLTDADAQLLADALRRHDPWLEWAGKREVTSFGVDPVALHIHERVSAQAILKVAARTDVTRDLFADPQLGYHEAVQFYRHEMDWSNRLILGDSLQVMASLAQREDLAGKVQMIYVDPPYGIRFASNFQTEIGKRDLKESERDLTREAEMVKAFRDTWTLGHHSYLTYLRDRLLVARTLLKPSGSVFLQIGEENVHRVRMLCDDVFGYSNFVSLITLEKTSGTSGSTLSSVTDYLLWYAASKPDLKYNAVFLQKQPGQAGGTGYNRVRLKNGTTVPLHDGIDEGEVYCLDNITSQSGGRQKGLGAACWFPVAVGGVNYDPGPTSTWKTNEEGISRLLRAERIEASGNRIGYVRKLTDFPVYPINNLWDDVMSSFMADKAYIVQTNAKIVERCLHLATAPGDLVLDPTCGGGTTAYVLEQWGRRWITIDTSRVALSITRQRLMTAKFEYYSLKDETTGISAGFRCKTVPHITLKSIAQNANLDPVFAKHESFLNEALAGCNDALGIVSSELRARLAIKLDIKQRVEGKRSITDADRRRWLLPPDNRDKHGTFAVDPKFRGWYHWEVPFDTDPDWPESLRAAVTGYRPHGKQGLWT